MKTIITAFTAVAIGFAALAAPAQAAPLGAPAQTVQVSADGIAEVGHRHRHRRRAAGTAAGIAIGLGALAIGSAIAAQPRRCYVEAVRVWSPRRQGYVYRERKVCR
ncbi:hypothetical protein [Acuticoccus sp. I52.16.1]|uniref:hypothetical protein n=1 Tax=Acuticoccus sp. I52.16.1 TaxID=2928472 RepID=UPI001FD50C0D|nr:hypothetical protein [Acuticoccus sp. I52.16.1]UOM32953.1 hypothetical protein MRB58_13830 [Acuticoccus sp. I52.16.1]